MLPLFFDDAHELSVLLDKLNLSISTPRGYPNQLDLSLHADTPGSISVKVDVSKLLTDALDLVEIENRLINQGLFH